MIDRPKVGEGFIVLGWRGHRVAIRNRGCNSPLRLDCTPTLRHDVGYRSVGNRDRRSGRSQGRDTVSPYASLARLLDYQGSLASPHAP